MPIYPYLGIIDILKDNYDNCIYNGACQLLLKVGAVAEVNYEELKQINNNHKKGFQRNA